MSDQFIATSPTLDAYWRSIILFGGNTASYKFALGTALLEFASRGSTFVRMDELALPFARAMVTHLRGCDRQITNSSSRCLDACREFIGAKISEAQLREKTVKTGFVYVIDRFHNVNGGEIAKRFYIDERKTKGGLTLTDNLLALKEQFQFQNLPSEVEARWRLVETAWSMGISANLLTVKVDPTIQVLFAEDPVRRINVTSCRDALNGYQKGKCFYCFRDISVEEGEDLADVDHFFPHVAWRRNANLPFNLDGVWNLVLACRDCNRGVAGKWARVPALPYLERLERRNDYLIDSHHPLRETLITHTGANPAERARFLRLVDQEVVSLLLHRWSATDEREPAF